MKKIYENLIVAGTISAITFGVIEATCVWSYNDMPLGVLSSSDARLKNSASAVVAGIVSQKLYKGNNKIELEAQKFLWSNAKITGETTSDSIDTLTDTWFSSSHFRASTDRKGHLEGRVNKSRYDWGVQSDKENNYRIARTGLSWDLKIKDLKIEHGKISGTLSRTGTFDSDLNINGEYSKDGYVKIDMDNSFSYGITLEGTITPK